jgi:hypothetical protein
MRSALGFSGKVLDAVRHDPRLVVLWGVGVSLLVLLGGVLSLTGELPRYGKLTTAAIVIVILAGLFAYTVPRVKPASPPPEELIAVLDDRAQVVQKRIASRRQGLLGAGRGGTGPRSNRARADKLRGLQGHFAALYLKHVDALRRGQYARAHEICQTIQQILIEVDEEFLSAHERREIHNWVALISESVVGLYPGPWPTNLSPGVSEDKVFAIWREAE